MTPARLAAALLRNTPTITPIEAAWLAYGAVIGSEVVSRAEGLEVLVLEDTVRYNRIITAWHAMFDAGYLHAWADTSEGLVAVAPKSGIIAKHRKVMYRTNGQGEALLREYIRRASLIHNTATAMSLNEEALCLV